MEIGIKIPSGTIHDTAEKIERTLWGAGNRTAFSRNAMVGEPLAEPPLFITDAIRNYAEKHSCREYPDYYGDRDVRETMADYLKQEYGITVGTENIIPTNGVADAFTKSMMLLIDKGDVVIAEAPSYGLHNRTVAQLGGVVYPLDILDKPAKRISPEELDAHITRINLALLTQSQDNKRPPRVKVYAHINPSNPLGRVIHDSPENRHYYKEIYQVLKKHDIVLFDDLVYRGTEYDPTKKALPFLQAVPEAFDRVITSFGSSKSMGTASIRSGVMIAPENFGKEAYVLTLSMWSGVSVLSQDVLAAAFDVKNKSMRDAYLQKNAEEYRIRMAACVVRLLGEEKALREHATDQQTINQVRKLFQLVAYARALKADIIKGKLCAPITSLIANDNSVELVLYYVFGELEDIEIKESMAKKIGQVYLHDLLNFDIPQKYKAIANSVADKWMKGTRKLAPYYIPESGFFFPINASAYFGKYAPVNVKRIVQERIHKADKKEAVPQGENPIPLDEDNLEPTKITSSSELNFFSSWFGNVIFIPGEMTGLDPSKMFLRLSVSSTPDDFIAALDGLDKSVSLLKDTPNKSHWNVAPTQTINVNVNSACSYYAFIL